MTSVPYLLYLYLRCFFGLAPPLLYLAISRLTRRIKEAFGRGPFLYRLMAAQVCLCALVGG